MCSDRIERAESRPQELKSARRVSSENKPERPSHGCGQRTIQRGIITSVRNACIISYLPILQYRSGAKTDIQDRLSLALT